MSSEIIVTSAPRGLDPGATGFCTVAATRDMPRLHVMQLEGLSSYAYQFNLSDDQADLSPVNFAHTRTEVGGRPRSVLSRIAFAGAEFTLRSNKIAHHLLLDPPEQAPDGPAWMMVHLARAGLFRTQYRDAPGWLPPRDLLKTAPPPRPPGFARTWQQVTGDAGWAGVLARAFRADPERFALVLFQPGTDLLPLFEEALAVLPPHERWQVGFCTYYVTLPPGTQYHWRGVVAGSDAAREMARLSPSAVIDLTRPLPRAPTDEFTEAARAGRCVEPVPSPTPPPAAGPAAAAPPVPQIAAVPSPRDLPVAQEAEPAEPMVEIPFASPAARRPPARRQGTWAPVLVGVVIVLILTNALTAWLLHSARRQADEDVGAARRQVAQASAWQAALAAAEAENWRDVARLEADRVKQAVTRANEAVAQRDPSAARRALLEVQEAVMAAERAAAHAEDLAAAAAKAADDLPGDAQAAASVAKARAARAAAHDHHNDALLAAGKKPALPADDGRGPPAPGPSAADLERDAKELLAAVEDESKKAAASAKAASDAARKAEAAVKADKPDEAKAAAVQASQAEKDALAAAVRADGALERMKGRLGPAAESGPAADALRQAQRVASDARERAAEARRDAARASASAAPVAQPKDLPPFKPAPENRADLAAKGFQPQAVPPSRDGTRYSFPVSTANAFVSVPPALSRAPAAPTLSADGRGLVIKGKAASGVVTFANVQLADEARGRVLHCTLFDGAEARHKDILEWLVLEVADPVNQRLYQCTLQRPKEEKHVLRFGYEARQGKVIEVVPPMVTLRHPWLETLALADKAGSRPLAAKPAEPWNHKVRCRAPDAPDTEVSLLLTFKAEKDGSVQVTAQWEGAPGVRTAAAAVAKQVAQLDGARANLEDKRRPDVEPRRNDKGEVTGPSRLDQANRTVADWNKSAEKPVPAEGEARVKFRAAIDKEVIALGAAIEQRRQAIRDQCSGIRDDKQRNDEIRRREDADEDLKRLRRDHDRARPLRDALDVQDRVRYLDQELAKVTAEFDKATRATQGLLDTTGRAVQDSPRIEIRDAWDLALLVLEFQFETCDAPTLIRGLK